MKKNIVWAVSAFAIMMAITLARTQGKPDFTGTWVVDTVERPERPDGGRREGGAGRRGGGFMRMLEKGDRVRIKHTAERLTVTSSVESGEQVNTYSLDGSESTNTSRRGGAMKTNTRWEGAALVTTGTRSVNGPMGEMTLKTREVRSLSDDGRLMTVRTTVDTPRGQMTTAVTFVRATS